MRMDEGAARVDCSNPIDAEALAEYWIAALGASEVDSVEEHLLECDECGDRLREVIALAEGVRQLAREGSLRMVVTDSFLQSAEEEGLRVRQYELPAGGGVNCTVTAEDNFLIGRLAADLSGGNRIDLAMCDGQGVEALRLRDIPFNPSAPSVIYQESIKLAKELPDCKLIARLLAVDATGDECLLGEYTFNHTRSMPDRDVQ